MLDIQEVYYSYDGKTNILKNISLNVSQVGMTAIIGHNGSGKTTLGKLMTGIFKPTSGIVKIDGRDASKMSLGEIGQRVGYLFQEPERQLFAPTVQEELSFIMKLKGVSNNIIAERVADMMELFQISHLKDSFPFQLSRGEKQRLALAAVLINGPEFLVLDEPTTGLDMQRKEKLSMYMENLLDKGIGMVVISHDSDFIKRHASRTIQLAGGEVISDTGK